MAERWHHSRTRGVTTVLTDVPQYQQVLLTHRVRTSAASKDKDGFVVYDNLKDGKGNPEKHSMVTPKEERRRLGRWAWSSWRGLYQRGIPFLLSLLGLSYSPP